jgi:hypothetical protein
LTDEFPRIPNTMAPIRPASGRNPFGGSQRIACLLAPLSAARRERQPTDCTGDD